MLNLCRSIKIAEAINLIENDGWFVVMQKGSLRQYKHQVKAGLVTIAVHRMSDEVAPGTFCSILKQAGLKNL